MSVPEPVDNEHFAEFMGVMEDAIALFAKAKGLGWSPRMRSDLSSITIELAQPPKANPETARELKLDTNNV